MTFPTVDILVPVWNNPFETRACLAAILTHSPDARLIIVDNGSSRETELMLEEFSEPLGDKGLFIKSERNVGLVAALNLGFARSDGDYTVIVRPNVTVQKGWLEALVAVAETTGAGIVSPLFNGAEAPQLPALAPGCTLMETGTVSFATLLLRGALRIVAGSFDDQLDGGEWCIKEYVRRAAAYGYHTFVTGGVRLNCAADQQFGSPQRRTEMTQQSIAVYTSRWGVTRHYCVYFGKETTVGTLDSTITAIVDGARQGHRFTLLLHGRLYRDFKRMGWNGLHTGIELQKVALLFPIADIARRVAALREAIPDLLAVRGADGVIFPGVETAISHDELLGSITMQTTKQFRSPEEVEP
jgi:glycosyltransferase involved in cell wall biosynthesis